MKKLKSKKLIKALAAVVLVVIVIIAGNFFTGNNYDKYKGKNFVAVLDVDQGDSILICSNGAAALIDTGKEMQSRELIKKLRNFGVDSLDALILTHSHEDHIGSAEYVISNFNVDNIVMPQFRADESESNESVKEVNRAIASSSAKVYSAIAGMVINIGEIEITVLHCDPSAEDINNRSIIAMADISGKKFLFTGDAEAPAEKNLIEAGINFDCDVLKVGHHGSKTSSSGEFLEIATPEFAAISVGSDNSYGLPNYDVIDRLNSIGAKVQRTDIIGDIIYTVEGQNIIIG